MGISVCTDLEEAGGFCLQGWSCTGAAFPLSPAPGALQTQGCTKHVLKSALSPQCGLSLMSSWCRYLQGDPLCSPQGVYPDPLAGCGVQGEVYLGQTTVHDNKLPWVSQLCTEGLSCW